MKPTWKSAGYLGGGESNRLLTANSNPVSSVKKAICFCRWYVHFSPKYVSKNSRAASTSDTWRSRCLSLMVHLLLAIIFKLKSLQLCQLDLRDWGEVAECPAPRGLR